METIKVYKVKVTGELYIKAKSSDDAINKTKEYYEDNIKELDFNWSEYSVFTEEGEGDQCPG